MLFDTKKNISTGIKLRTCNIIPVGVQLFLKRINARNHSCDVLDFHKTFAEITSLAVAEEQRVQVKSSAQSHLAVLDLVHQLPQAAQSFSLWCKLKCVHVAQMEVAVATKGSIANPLQLRVPQVSSVDLSQVEGWRVVIQSLQHHLLGGNTSLGPSKLLGHLVGTAAVNILPPFTWIMHLNKNKNRFLKPKSKILLHFPKLFRARVSKVCSLRDTPTPPPYIQHANSFREAKEYQI